MHDLDEASPRRGRRAVIAAALCGAVAVAVPSQQPGTLQPGTLQPGTQQPGAQQPSAQQPRRAELQQELLRTAEQVQREVEQLRGYEFKRPVQKSVMTKDELRDVLAALMAEEFAGGKLERTEAWLRALALLPADLSLAATLTDVLLSQVGGFYDPKQGSFFMMVEARKYGDTLNRMMIAHELCHALDDQYCDLEALLHPEPPLSEDMTYVVGGVVEGSATLLMSAWLQQALQRGADMADMRAMAEQQKDQMAVLLQAPRYCALLAANYMVGQHFLTRGAGLAGAMGDSGAVIRDVVADMPRSTEQLLHPDKYWDPDARDEPVRLRSAGAAAERIAAWTDLRVLHQDTLGEMVAALVAMPQRRKLNPALMARADYWTNRAARGWGGDRMFVVGAGPLREGAPVREPGVVWVTAWDTVEDREEFVAAVRRYRGEEPGFDVAADGRVAVFAFGSARLLDAAQLAGLLEGCEFEQGAAPWRR